MVKITFPDGSVREYEQGVTGFQIAESISPALARDVVSCGVNGETTELNRPINEDATIALYKFDDEEGKHTFWHTSAHLLAEALQELYPGIQFGFGPAVENGFFYDVMPAEGQTISENDFPKIEEKMRELAKKNEQVVRRDVSKADAVKEFTADGQEYKVEHIVEDLEDGTISTYSQGNFTDLSVVALLSLLKHFKIFIEHLLFREGDTVDTCHLLALSIATPESTSNAGYLDSFDSTC